MRHALFAAAILATLGQQPQPSMQDGLAAAVRQLGACQSDLGALRSLQADVIAGKYVDWSVVKQQIEAANPALVFDLATKKLTPKPEPEKSNK